MRLHIAKPLILEADRLSGRRRTWIVVLGLVVHDISQSFDRLGVLPV